MRKAVAAVIMAAIFGLFSYTVAVSQAQTPPKPHVTILVDNANIRVQRVTFSPGARAGSPNAKHPVAALAYVIDGPAHVKYTYADGHSVTRTIATGSDYYQTGEAEGDIYRTNVGSNSFTWLVVLFKK